MEIRNSIDWDLLEKDFCITNGIHTKHHMTEYLKAKLNGTEFELGSKEMFHYIFGEF